MRQQGTLMRNTNLDDLNQRIKICRIAKLRDSEGNIYDGSEEVRFNCWAKVLPYASKISNGYSEKVNEVDYRITIRARDGIMPTDIVRWRDKRMQIISNAYDAEGGGKWTILECKDLIEDG